MADVKTKRNKASVAQFLDTVADEQRRSDSKKVLAMIKKATGYPPRMWGDSIVGFGSYHYKYASGREGDWPLAGFSPRKQALTLYIMPGFKRYPELMKKLGKHKTGSSCLYLKKLEDVDLDVLQTLVKESVRYMEKKYNR
jgi:hypothetical protein